jgi:membrane protein
VGVSRYNAIYGSFAALPLLLFWIRISWLIVLFGAEISFANQNVEYYEFEHEAKNISHFNKKILALYMYNLIAKRFAGGETPLTPPQLALKLEMPIVLVREVLDDMTELGLLVETKSQHHKENAYQPASDIYKVTVKTIIDKLENQGTGSMIIKETEELDEFKRTLRAFGHAVADSPENKLVKDF